MVLDSGNAFALRTEDYHVTPPGAGPMQLTTRLVPRPEFAVSPLVGWHSVDRSVGTCLESTNWRHDLTGDTVRISESNKFRPLASSFLQLCTGL